MRWEACNKMLLRDNVTRIAVVRTLVVVFGVMVGCRYDSVIIYSVVQVRCWACSGHPP
jgi:hypothetical protein